MIMKVVHLTDSPFFGGPERQMLGLAVGLPASIRTSILCFRDHASAVPFLRQLESAGVPARLLSHANPHFMGMVADVANELRSGHADLLVCHGYKADVIGWLAAGRAGVPVISVSRGWTAHTRKVRLNEAIDRLMLRLMAGVVCVSEGQAVKVRQAGVRSDRIHVIPNAIDTSRFAETGPGGQAPLTRLFASAPELVVVGVGRLSPEKGFDQLIEAARLVVSSCPDAGFVLIGDGPDRERLKAQVRAAGMQSHVVFSGFRSDVDLLLGGADVLAQASYTEGLPNVVLEACAAGIPVVATDVGGTREVVQDGVNGYLVPPGNPRALAARLVELLRAPSLRHSMGACGRELVGSRFSFANQCRLYMELFRSVTICPGEHGSGRVLSVSSEVSSATR